MAAEKIKKFLFCITLSAFFVPNAGQAQGPFDSIRERLEELGVKITETEEVVPEVIEDVADEQQHPQAPPENPPKNAVAATAEVPFGRDSFMPTLVQLVGEPMSVADAVLRQWGFNIKSEATDSCRYEDEKYRAITLVSTAQPCRTEGARVKEAFAREDIVGEAAASTEPEFQQLRQEVGPGAACSTSPTGGGECSWDQPASMPNVAEVSARVEIMGGVATTRLYRVVATQAALQAGPVTAVQAPSAGATAASAEDSREADPFPPNNCNPPPNPSLGDGRRFTICSMAAQPERYARGNQQLNMDFLRCAYRELRGAETNTQVASAEETCRAQHGNAVTGSR